MIWRWIPLVNSGIALAGAAWGIQHWRGLDRSQRLLLLWVGALPVFDLLRTYLQVQHGNNYLAFHLEAPVEAVVMLCLFSLWSKGWKAPLFLGLAGGYFAYWGLAHWAWEGWHDFRGYTRPVQSLLLISASMLLLNTASQDDEQLLTDLPQFWIASSTLMNGLAAVFVHLFLDWLLTVSIPFARGVVRTKALLGLAATAMLVKGLRCPPAK